MLYRQRSTFFYEMRIKLSEKKSPYFEKELPNQAARKKQSTPLFREFPRRLPSAAEFREA